MTDKELAEEWFNEYKPPECMTLNGRKGYSKRQIKQAFLAGLEAGKPQWHDLRKDPNDLPPPKHYVLSDFGSIVYLKDSNWYEATLNFSPEIDEPIAWCEIPKFEENE